MSETYFSRKLQNATWIAIIAMMLLAAYGIYMSHSEKSSTVAGKTQRPAKEIILNNDGYKFYVVDASLHRPDDRGKIMQYFFENHNVTEYTVYVTRTGEMTRIVGIRYK